MVPQLRPTEVLFEEWAALRSRGIATPQIAVWNCLPTGATLWQLYLQRIYNNASYDALLLRDPSTNKRVFFVPRNPSLPPDPSLVAAVASNGGRDDVLPVFMWADFDPSQYNAGVWGFFSPCTDGGKETTSVTNLAAGCRQYVTQNSPLGRALAVSPSYQINFGSVPFGAAGKLGGMTLQLQFQTAFSEPLDHVFLSSFNEHIAQPQANPFPGPYSFSMGLENGACWAAFAIITTHAARDTDPARSSLWVDSYGSGISRDIEATVEGGTM
jgi:hypothetical protein